MGPPRDRGRWHRKGYAAHRPTDWSTVPEGCRLGADPDAELANSDAIAEAWRLAADPASQPRQDAAVALIDARRRAAGKGPSRVDLGTPRAVHLVLESTAEGWSPAVEPIEPAAIAALARDPARCRVCRGGPLVTRTGAIAVCLGCSRSGVDDILLPTREARHA